MTTLKGKLALVTGSTRCRGNGRIIDAGSSTTRLPQPDYALYGGSKIAPQYLVEALAKLLGDRGVTVNSILPTAIEGAGVYTTVRAIAFASSCGRPGRSRGWGRPTMLPMPRSTSSAISPVSSADSIYS